VSHRPAARGQLEGVPLAALREEIDGLTRAADGDCARCGLSCCHLLVRVFPEEVAPLEGAAAALGDPRPLWTEAGPDDPAETRAFARPEPPRCRFLEADDRCAIHRALGPTRKPMTCQLYPAWPLLTPAGLRLSHRPECPWPRPRAAPEELEAARALLHRRATSATPEWVAVAPEEVRLDVRRRVPFAAFAEWSAAAGELLSRSESTAAGLRAVAASLADRWGAGPPAAPGALPTVASAVASAVEACGASAEGRALRAAAAAGDALDPSGRPVPPRLLSVAVADLDLLRYPSVLAGLGLYRLLTAAARHLERPDLTPEERLAALFRAIEAERARLLLAFVAPSTLEALAAT